MLSKKEYNEIYDRLKSFYIKREDIEENLCMEDVMSILRDYVEEIEQQDI